MILKFAAEMAFSLEISLKIALQLGLRVMKQYGWDAGREGASRAAEIENDQRVISWKIESCRGRENCRLEGGSEACSGIRKSC
jgi:hypothetical protein